MNEAKAGPARKLPLHWKMAIGFVAGLLLGLVAYYSAGADAPWVQWLTTWITQPAATLFLRLLFMLVIPLMFSALVLGVAELGDLRALGRIGLKTLVYTVVVSAIAVVIGVVLVNVFQPGEGVDPALAQQLLSRGSDARRRSSAAAPSSPRASTCCCRSCPTTSSRRRPTATCWR